MGFKIENGVLIKYTEDRNVTEITIPDRVTSIGHDAFWGCASLTSITI
ncbi:MAG: leucine-rich repeat protein, partial [Oscillospiraceae bacterium]|nr:leucine-rich repeat protein [Oscillospiraceae bacterium]